jgi:hypothetical protein
MDFRAKVGDQATSGKAPVDISEPISDLVTRHEEVSTTDLAGKLHLPQEFMKNFGGGHESHEIHSEISSSSPDYGSRPVAD